MKCLCVCRAQWEGSERTTALTTARENKLQRHRVKVGVILRCRGCVLQELLRGGRWLDRPQKLRGGASGLLGTDWPNLDHDVMRVSLADNASRSGSVICDAAGWSCPTVGARSVRWRREERFLESSCPYLPGTPAVGKRLHINL